MPHYATDPPPEVIEEHGSIENWQDLVGTGPYMLVDWVKGSSISYQKNPDDWGFDEKFPDNRLPYIDTLTTLVILEVPTILAALRSGQVDHIGEPGASQLKAVDEADSLRRTNPELVMTLSFNARTPLFDWTRPSRRSTTSGCVRRCRMRSISRP